MPVLFFFFLLWISEPQVQAQAKPTDAKPPKSCEQFVEVKTAQDLKALRQCARQLKQEVVRKRRADLMQFRIDSSQTLVDQIKSSSNPIPALNTPNSPKTASKTPPSQ